MGREGYRRREKKDKKGREGESHSNEGRSGRETQKGKRLLLFTSYDPLKNMKPLTHFATFIYEKTKIYARNNLGETKPSVVSYVIGGE